MPCFFLVQQYQIIFFLYILHVFLKHCHCDDDSFNHKCHHDNDRIIGGKPASIQDFPFIVSIIFKYKEADADFRGAAIIVSKRWSLTAAHCMHQFGSGVLESGYIYLRSNTDVWNNNPNVGGYKEYKDHQIVKSHTHSKFGVLSEYDSDIAILKVKEPFDGNYEKPIRVAGKHFMEKRNVVATTLGWGTTNYDVQIPTDKLQSVSIDIFTHKKCVNAFKNNSGQEITCNMICGGSYSGGRDSCSGDSGGPLVQLNVLIGIVSYGVQCGLEQYPGVYTKVAAFHDWIQNLEKKLGTNFGIKYVNNVGNRTLKSAQIHYKRLKHKLSCSCR